MSEISPLAAEQPRSATPPARDEVHSKLAAQNTSRSRQERHERASRSL